MVLSGCSRSKGRPPILSSALMGTRVYTKLCRFASVLDERNIEIDSDLSLCKTLIKGDVIHVEDDEMIVDWDRIGAEVIEYATQESIFKTIPKSFSVVAW